MWMRFLTLILMKMKTYKRRGFVSSFVIIANNVLYLLYVFTRFWFIHFYIEICHKFKIFIARATENEFHSLFSSLLAILNFFDHARSVQGYFLFLFSFRTSRYSLMFYIWHKENKRKSYTKKMKESKCRQSRVAPKILKIFLTVIAPHKNEFLPSLYPREINFLCVEEMKWTKKNWEEIYLFKMALIVMLYGI
jgi:hypothetical protein